MKPIIAALLFLFTLFSCKHTDNDPQAVGKAFIDAVLKKDFDKASMYASANSQSVMEMLKSAERAYKLFGNEDKFDIVKELRGKKLEFTEPKMDGDSRATETILADGQEKMLLVLIKENEKWKVAFDIATIMDVDRSDKK